MPEPLPLSTANEARLAARERDGKQPPLLVADLDQLEEQVLGVERHVTETKAHPPRSPMAS
jgi:hypothetical protein